jgi:hypothetical protein
MPACVSSAFTLAGVVAMSHSSRDSRRMRSAHAGAPPHMPGILVV